MADRDPFDLVEMSQGAQPPSGFGDRILVGLALIALVGGALVAVANLVPDPGEVAEASLAPSEKPTRTPRPSPTPRLPRVATLQDPDIGLAPPEQSYQFDGWILALDDLVIRSSPDLLATDVGILAKDEVAYASQQDEPAEEPGWLFLQEGNQGWVATIAGGELLARRYEYPRVRSSGWIDSLTAGPDGFVAMVTQPGGPYSFGPPQPATSADGASWRTASSSSFDGWWVGSIAHGPSGWLAAAAVSDESQERILIWSSPDGLQWRRLGMLGGLNGEWVEQLIGSDDRYLLETQSPNRGSNATTLWSSSDDMTWDESTEAIKAEAIQGDRRIVALAGGFYMWSTSSSSLVIPGSATTAAFSVDGLTWTAVENAPDGVNLRLTDFRGRVVAIDLDRATLAPRVWSGSVADGRLVWNRRAEGDNAFAGGVTTRVVSDGASVFAFGWDRSTEQPLVWTGNGMAWVRTPFPESFGGYPVTAAAGPHGVVVLGSRHTLRGENPIAWHRTADGGWLPEPNPILPAVLDPTSEECPALPTEYLEFMVVEAAGVVSCHGDAPITFQAFSVPCEGCYGTMEGNPQPAWLLSPSGLQLYLSPNESSSGGGGQPAVLRPPLVGDPAWTGNLLELTGHFDDAAATTCQVEPTADALTYGYWTGRHSIIDQCRLTFVVTDVTVVSTP